jgi:hypothetical protein
MKTKKPYRRNALYGLLEEYLRNQPEAKPGQAWAHFGSLTQLGATPGLIAFDGKEIEFAPDPERLRTKTVSFASFARRFYFIKKDVFHETS